jgi:hypothetical protein
MSKSNIRNQRYLGLDRNAIVERSRDREGAWFHPTSQEPTKPPSGRLQGGARPCGSLRSATIRRPPPEGRQDSALGQSESEPTAGQLIVRNQVQRVGQCLRD